MVSNSEKDLHAESLLSSQGAETPGLLPVSNQRLHLDDFDDSVDRNWALGQVTVDQEEARDLLHQCVTVAAFLISPKTYLQIF